MQCKWTVKITILLVSFFFLIHSQFPKRGRRKGNEKEGKSNIWVDRSPLPSEQSRRWWDCTKQTSVKCFKREGFRLWWAPDVFWVEEGRRGEERRGEERRGEESEHWLYLGLYVTYISTTPTWWRSTYYVLLCPFKTQNAPPQYNTTHTPMSECIHRFFKHG